VTGVEYICRRLGLLLGELDELAERPEFDAEDPWRYVRDAAALLERFLKGATFPATAVAKEPSLNRLILALGEEGVDSATVDALHEVRKAANAGKHEPARRLSLLDARAILVEAMDRIGGLATCPVPEFAAAHSPSFRRRYVIAVYDHLTAGETYFEIWLPAALPDPERPLALPEAIETFQIDYREEGAIRSALEALGDGIFEGVEEALREPFKGDEEFHTVWIWEGEHRDLVSAFAPHQHELELLPGLLRGDHAPSVLSACAVALVELPPGVGWQDILWKISTEFAISRRGTLAEPLARAAAELRSEVGGATLAGPRWALSPALEETETKALVRHGGHLLAVTDEDEVWVGLDPEPRGLTVRVMSEEDMRRPEDPLP
jgi:hypothetical protein